MFKILVVEDDMSKLRKLDAEVTNKATMNSLVIGIIGALIMGTGMSFAMGVIGDKSITSMVIGIIIGLVGICGVSINYFIYKKLLTKGKLKYGSDITRLANEIASE